MCACLNCSKRRRSRLFFFQAEDGIRDKLVTGVQTCALPICPRQDRVWPGRRPREWHDDAGRGRNPPQQMDYRIVWSRRAFQDLEAIASYIAQDSPALTQPVRLSTLTVMEVHFRPDTESRLQELAAKTGRAPDDLIEDAMAGYLQELAQVREMLDSRYDEFKSGAVKPVDGEEAFDRLRRKSKNRKSDNNDRRTSRS